MCHLTVPDAPTALNVSSIANTSAEISWMPPVNENGIITNYTIEIFSGVQVVISQTLTASDLEYMATGLNPFTNYSVSVYASTSAGAGETVSEEFMTDTGSEFLHTSNVAPNLSVTEEYVHA